MTEKTSEKSPWITVAKLKEILEKQPDDAVCVVENGTTICKGVRSAEGFRGKQIDHKGGDGFRLGAGGDARLIVLTVS